MNYIQAGNLVLPNQGRKNLKMIGIDLLAGKILSLIS